MSTKSTIAFTLTALAAGAALGILFAPDSGQRTRRKIMRKGEAMQDKLSGLIDEGKELLSDLKKDAGDMAANAVKKAKA